MTVQKQINHDGRERSTKKTFTPRLHFADILTRVCVSYIRATSVGPLVCWPTPASSPLDPLGHLPCSLQVRGRGASTLVTRAVAARGFQPETLTLNEGIQFGFLVWSCHGGIPLHLFWGPSELGACIAVTDPAPEASQLRHIRASGGLIPRSAVPKSEVARSVILKDIVKLLTCQRRWPVLDSWHGFCFSPKSCTFFPCNPLRAGRHRAQ